MLVTLNEMKAYLNIDVGDDSEDSFLTTQINLISDTIEAYCRRRFSRATYVETFYRFDLQGTKLYTANYPVVNVVSAIGDGETLADYRVHKASGQIFNLDWFQPWGNEGALVITYEAGYDVIPTPIKYALMTLVSQQFAKKSSGVGLNFGSDVQRVSIPGTISIDFDYSLTDNEATNLFGSLLGNMQNVLTLYKSDRAFMGSGKLRYVEEVP